MKTKTAATLKTLCSIMMLTWMFAAPSPVVAQDITTGLISHFEMEETSGTTATDNGSLGNNGTYASVAPATDSTQGNFGKGIDFSQNQGSRIDAPDNATYQGLTTLTYAAWIRPNAFSNFMGIIDIENVGAFYLNFDTNRLAFSANAWSTQNGVWTIAPLSQNSWQHVAVTYNYGDPVGTPPVIYINGQNAGTLSVSFAPIGSYSAPGTAPTHIGNANISGISRNFHGIVDDVRIYDRVLTAQDIQALYEAPLQSCELQNQGSMIYNTDGHVMQYCNSSNWVAMGKERYVPEAVKFDGTNSYLTRGGDLTGIADGKQVTGSVWFRRNSYGNGDVHEIYQTAGASFRITIDISDRLRVVGENAAGTQILSTIGPTITDSDWHHVAFSIDMADQANSRIYLDDADVTGFSIFTDDDLDLSTTAHAIGSNGSPANLFDGDIADLWLEFGAHIDLSVVGNRRKFINASSNPVDLGTRGEGPLGIIPDIFLSGDTTDWHTNKGTGGGFTENGALDEAIGPSKITGGVSNLSSIPACPTSTSAHSFSLAGTLPAAGREFLGLWVDPPYIFAGNGWTGGDTPFEVYTFDGSNFTLIDSVLSGHGFPENIWSDGTYYYVASPGTGLFAYTFDGTDLTLVGSETTVADEARSPWGDGTYIYVADGTGGFHAFTFDGTTFTQAGSSLSTNGFALSAYADGEYVYLGDGGGGLRIYTFDGTNWTLIDDDTTYTARKVWDDGNYLYLIGSDGLVAFDFDGTTLTPLAVESASIGGNSDVWGDGQFIYVAASSTNGVRVYDFNGSEFTLIDTYASVTDMRSVAGDGTYIFAGDRTQGLYALNGFECQQCTGPTGRAGDIIYNTTTNQMQYCNAEQWIAMGPTGNGGAAGCSDPSGSAGDLLYNTSYSRMQYCEGDEWISVGGSLSDSFEAWSSGTGDFDPPDNWAITVNQPVSSGGGETLRRSSAADSAIVNTRGAPFSTGNFGLLVILDTGDGCVFSCTPAPVGDSVYIEQDLNLTDMSTLSLDQTGDYCGGGCFGAGFDLVIYVNGTELYRGRPGIGGTATADVSGYSGVNTVRIAFEGQVSADSFYGGYYDNLRVTP